MCLEVCVVSFNLHCVSRFLVPTFLIGAIIGAVILVWLPEFVLSRLY